MVPRLDAVQVAFCTLQFAELHSSPERYRASLELPSQGLEGEWVRRKARCVNIQPMLNIFDPGSCAMLQVGVQTTDPLLVGLILQAAKMTICAL